MLELLIGGVSALATIVGGLVWLVRLEGRINVQQSRIDASEKRIDGLEQRISEQLDRIERRLDALLRAQ